MAIKLAIVGMDTLFGMCNGLDNFERTIYETTQHFIPVPPTRCKQMHQRNETCLELDSQNTKTPQGAYIKSFEFDAFRFKIPPNDLNKYDAQQLLMLMVIDNALKDANLYKKRKISENLAIVTATRDNLVDASDERDDSDDALKKEKNIVFSKISALWNVTGLNFNVSAQENSVFEALEIAKNLLTVTSIDAVVVGAVNFVDQLNSVSLHHRLASMSTGRLTLSYDCNASGLMLGEGAGAVVLKRYERAKYDNDRIYAVIDAVHLSDKSIVTSHEAVKQCCQKAFESARVNPMDIGYLEVFGSGIEEQDEAEIQGLIDAYQIPKPELVSCPALESTQGKSDTRTDFYNKQLNGLNLSCAIGSIKTNIGHTNVASGMASLIKTALCLYNRYIPGTPQWSSPKRLEVWQNSPFYVPTEPRPWFLTEGASKRIAAINSLANDGTYAHLIVSEDVSQQDRNNKSLKQTSFYLFPIAANDQSALLEQLDALQQRIENSSSLSIAASQTFVIFQSYSQATYALAIVGYDKDELSREIERARKGVPNVFATGKEWKSPLGSYFTAKPLGKEGNVAFVYPGAFNSYIGMARNLFHLFPKIYEHSANFISNPSVFFREKLLYPRSLSQLSKKELEAFEEKLINDSLSMLETGTGFAVLFTQILKNYFRVQPQVAFGYSMGESTMMYALGVWPNADYGSHFVHSSSLFQTRLGGSKNAVLDHWEKSGEQDCKGEDVWSSYVLMTPVSRVMEYLKKESRVYLTHINTPTEVAIAGDSQACMRVIEALNCDSFRTPSNLVLHCEAMSSEYNELRKLNTVPFCNVPEIVFYSSASYSPIPLDSESIAHNLATGVCQCLDFPRLINQVYQDGARIFIELGSGSTCSRWIAENLKQKEHVAISINRRGTDDYSVIVKALAQLLSHQVPLDLSPLYHPVSETANGKKSVMKTVTLERYQLTPTNSPDIILNTDEVLEFTEGQVSRVFGQDYTSIDAYARRVRLPSPPYLFVSRVTILKGQRGDYKSGFIQTEYDIPQNAWYSVDGKIPVSIFEEAGHGLLLLLSYLGSDFENQGKRSFRLLDLTATFLDEQPEEIKTLRYDIKINSSLKTKESLLIFFSADCWIGDKLFIKLSAGCAGLFSDEELEQGQGIVVSEREKKERSKVQKQNFEPLLSCQKSVFDKKDLLNLSQGNIAACFGKNYKQNGLNPSLRLPPEKLMVIDRVISVNPKGGSAGLGIIIAEKSVEPDDWYFLCHFKNDPTMPGSLMIEGGAQLLQFYILFLGLQTCTLDAKFQPIPERSQVSRFRGQVTPTSGALIYQLEIMEIGMSPKVYAVGNVHIIFGGKTIAFVKNLGFQLSEKSQETLFHKLNVPQKSVLFNEAQIAELAKGSLENCLGSEYQIYKNRRAVRLPNSDLCLMSRVLEVDVQADESKRTSGVVTEYDVPPEAWFYRHNSYPYLPYCTYIEISGQPCIFLGIYLGTTLLFPNEDLYFRNLDGQGKILRDVDVRGKTITDKVRLLSSTVVKGVIIQKFEFQLSCDGEPFYQGDMVFGYFSRQVMANQVGLDGGKFVKPWYEENNHSNLPLISINLKNLVNQQKFYHAHPSKPHYRLAQGQLDFLDEVLIVEAGGKYDQGYIYASKNISPTDWYFPCHFHQDPVIPGALGVEAILQAIQVYMLQLDMGRHFQSPRFGQVLNHQITWKYRGQITPELQRFYFEVHISKVHFEKERVVVIGDANLWKENIRIYEIKDVAICLLES